METKKRGYLNLTLGGIERTLHFSMNFWAIFEECTGYSLTELDKVFGDKLSVSSLRALVYAGCKAYDLENKIEIDYTIYDAGNWLEDITMDNLTQITETIIESRVLGNDLNTGVRRNVTKSTKDHPKKNAR
jgi:hypothetical protein